MSDLAELEEAIAAGTTPDLMVMGTHWGKVICDRGVWRWRDYAEKTLTFDVDGVIVTRTAQQAAEDVLRPA